MISRLSVRDGDFGWLSNRQKSRDGVASLNITAGLTGPQPDLEETGFLLRVLDHHRCVWCFQLLGGLQRDADGAAEPDSQSRQPPASRGAGGQHGAAQLSAQAAAPLQNSQRAAGRQVETWLHPGSARQLTDCSNPWWGSGATHTVTPLFLTQCCSRLLYCCEECDWPLALGGGT